MERFPQTKRGNVLREVDPIDHWLLVGIHEGPRQHSTSGLHVRGQLAKSGDSAQNPPPPQTKPTFLQRPAGLRSPKYCGMGGRRYGQTEDQAELPSPSASAAGSGSLQIGGAQQPRLASLAPRL